MFSSSALLVAACVGFVTAMPTDIPHDVRLMERAQYYGKATVYSVSSGAEGSCETSLNDSQYFVALSNNFMNNESPNSQYCGKQITLTNTGASYSGVGGTGNTVTVTVVDTCPSCSTAHLDLSVAAWNSLTDNTPYGVTGISWSFDS